MPASQPNLCGYATVKDLWVPDQGVYRMEHDKEPLTTDGIYFLVRQRYNTCTKLMEHYVAPTASDLEQVLQPFLTNSIPLSDSHDGPMADVRSLILNIGYLGTRLSSQTPSFQAFTEYMTKEWNKHDETYTMMRKTHKVAWESLWLLFVPGEIIVTKCTITGAPKCFSLTSALQLSYQTLEVQGQFLDFDGKLYYRPISLMIDRFDGTRAITNLAAYPLKYHPAWEVIRQQLCKRAANLGEGPDYRNYHFKGRAFQVEDGKINTFALQGPITIDSKFCPHTNRDLNPYHPSLDSKWNTLITKTPKDLTWGEKCILTPTVLGHHDLTRRWLHIPLENLGPHVWKMSALPTLIPGFELRSISACLNCYVSTAKGVDMGNSQLNKHQGFRGLVHGPVGSGKDDIVKAAADFLQKKLYPISFAQYAICKDAEEQLDTVLKMSREWDQVLLLREADKALEHCEQSILPALLRQLENFPGAVFLTTSDVIGFDQVSLNQFHWRQRVGHANSHMRKWKWESLLAAKNKAITLKLTEPERETLVEKELNLRQIEGAVCTATAIAQSEYIDLDFDLLAQCIKNEETFSNNRGGVY